MILKRNILVAATNWLARASSILGMIVVLPALLSSLGPERYAIFAVFLSLFMWVSLADLGLANALVNPVSSSRAKGLSPGPYLFAASTLGVALLIIWFGLFLLFRHWLAEQLFHRMPFLSVEERNITFLLGTTLMLVAAFGNIGIKAAYALDYGWAANLNTATGYILSAIAVYYVSTNSAGNLTMVVLAYWIPIAATALLTATLFLRFRLFWRKREALEAVPDMARLALKFWLFSVIQALAINSDYLVMSQVLNPRDIASYAVLSRIFGVISILFQGLFHATWPSCTQMIAKGDITSFRKTFRTYRLIALTGALGIATLLIVSMPWILKVLTPNKDLVAPFGTMALFALYQLCRVWTELYIMALLAKGDIGALWKWILVQACISVGIQFYLGRLLGVNGILLGLIVSSVVTLAWLLPLRVRNWIASMSALEHQSIGFARIPDQRTA